jgi:hypothetical protein
VKTHMLLFFQPLFAYALGPLSLLETDGAEVGGSKKGTTVPVTLLSVHMPVAHTSQRLVGIAGPSPAEASLQRFRRRLRASWPHFFFQLSIWQIQPYTY